MKSKFNSILGLNVFLLLFSSCCGGENEFYSRLAYGMTEKEISSLIAEYKCLYVEDRDAFVEYNDCLFIREREEDHGWLEWPYTYCVCFEDGVVIGIVGYD